MKTLDGVIAERDELAARVAALEAALKEIGETWTRTGESRELRDTIVRLTVEFYPL